MLVGRMNLFMAISLKVAVPNMETSLVERSLTPTERPVHPAFIPRNTAKVLTMDEARRIASNIAKLPTLLDKK